MLNPTFGCAASRAGELSARCTSNIVHGFAAMGHHPGGALLAACAAQAAARMRDANLQSVSCTLWGFATMSSGGVTVAGVAARRPLSCSVPLFCFHEL